MFQVSGFVSRGSGFQVPGMAGARGWGLGVRASPLVPGFQVPGFGFGFGFRVQGYGIHVSGSGFRVPGSGCRVSGSGFRVPDSGVSESGFRVSGSGFRILGLENVLATRTLVGVVDPRAPVLDVHPLQRPQPWRDSVCMCM